MFKLSLFTKHLFLLIPAVIIYSKGYCQIDPHFSQYYAYPSYLNPALTGVFSGQYRLTALSRTQWVGVTKPFNTNGITADMATESNINLGIGIQQQSVKDVGYKYATGNINIAYTGVKFGADQHHRVSFGLQPGFISRRIDVSQLTFGDQWSTITGYSPSNATQEVVANTNSFSFDLGAGLIYYNTNPFANLNPFLGVSVSHLNNPKNSFFDSKESIIPMRTTVHGGLRIAFSDRFQFTPNALYMIQGSATEIMAGGFAEIKAKDFVSLFIGANYRIKDAVSSYLGFGIGSFMIGFSYDTNISNLGSSSRGNSSFELSISYFKQKRIKNEELEFICPRL